MVKKTDKNAHDVGFLILESEVCYEAFRPTPVLDAGRNGAQSEECTQDSNNSSGLSTYSTSKPSVSSARSMAQIEEQYGTFWININLLRSCTIPGHCISLWMPCTGENVPNRHPGVRW